jgi:hypothetical protein
MLIRLDGYVCWEATWMTSNRHSVTGSASHTDKQRPTDLGVAEHPHMPMCGQEE